MLTWHPNKIHTFLIVTWHNVKMFKENKYFCKNIAIYKSCSIYNSEKKGLQIHKSGHHSPVAGSLINLLSCPNLSSFIKSSRNSVPYKYRRYNKRSKNGLFIITTSFKSICFVNDCLILRYFKHWQPVRENFPHLPLAQWPRDRDRH